MKRNHYLNIFFSCLISLMLFGAAGAAEIEPDVEAFEEALASYSEDGC